jgi:hypothetical protein
MWSLRQQFQKTPELQLRPCKPAHLFEIPRMFEQHCLIFDFVDESRTRVVLIDTGAHEEVSLISMSFL